MRTNQARVPPAGDRVPPAQVLLWRRACKWDGEGETVSVRLARKSARPSVRARPVRHAYCRLDAFTRYMNRATRPGRKKWRTKKSPRRADPGRHCGSGVRCRRGAQRGRDPGKTGSREHSQPRRRAGRHNPLTLSIPGVQKPPLPHRPFPRIPINGNSTRQVLQALSLRQSSTVKCASGNYVDHFRK